MTGWEPDRYLRFADERSRPFVDLTARIDATAPTRVVDLGCGPGTLTATLAQRWPEATVLGIDSSPEMIDAARSSTGGTSSRLRFELGDVADFAPDEPYDVVVSNATLQWVDGHRDLLPRLLDAVAPGGWLAFQVPGNFTAPSHRLLAELARDERFAEAVGEFDVRHVADAADYLADLTALGCTVDAWETTYQHVLTGPDPVFTWISATGARPVLQALEGDLLDEFVADYQAALREAYPPRPFGTVLAFRRIFVVARKDG